MNYIISKHSSNQVYNYHPKTINELKELIDKLTVERGNKADLNDIDTSSITDMRRLFMGSLFNGDISKWDVSNVKNMLGMFTYSSFNGDISKWNVNKVENMFKMFNDSSLQTNPPSWYCN